MRLEEQKLKHRNEVSRLESSIQSLETDSETPMMRDVVMERQRQLENEYRHQIDGLTSKVNTLQEDNITLKHKVEKDGKQRSSDNDKWRNSALQEQVMKLQQRLREYEGDNDSVRSNSSRPRRIPRSPHLRKGSSRDDNSTRTE